MIQEFQRLNLELELFSARRRADEYRPFTPAWDAAISDVEDLERCLWGLDQAAGEAIRQGVMDLEASRP